MSTVKLIILYGKFNEEIKSLGNIEKVLIERSALLNLEI